MVRTDRGVPPVPFAARRMMFFVFYSIMDGLYFWAFYIYFQLPLRVCQSLRACVGYATFGLLRPFSLIFLSDVMHAVYRWWMRL